MVLILRRDDILGVLAPPRFMGELVDRHRTVKSGEKGEKYRVRLPGAGTAVVLLPGLLPDVPAYTVKVNAKFPGSTPAIKGLVCLHSLADGELLAVADSATITAWRTGLSAALATDLLATATADSVAVIGAGTQATTTLHGLLARRPIHRLVVTDIDPDRAVTFAESHAEQVDDVMVVRDAHTAAAGTDIVVTATWSRTPVLRHIDLKAGQHITSLGADEYGKRELDDDVLARCEVFVDDRLLATAHGVLSTGAAADAAELGEVLRGERPGRHRSTDITIYAPVGQPWLDLALTWQVYLAAREHRIGQEVDRLW